MKNTSLVIYRDVNVPIVHKAWHIRYIGDLPRKSFIKDSGDLPVVHFNSVTGQIEPVVNTRGRAYATRNRLMFRRRKV